MSEIWQESLGLSSAVVHGLACWSWQAAVLLAGAWLIASLVPRRRPSVRNALWLAALFMVPLIPAANRFSPLPTTPLEVPRYGPRTLSRAAQPAAGSPSAQTPGATPGRAGPALRSPPVPSPEGPSVQKEGAWTDRAAEAVLAVWAIGVAVMLARVLRAGLSVRRLCRSAPEATDPWLLNVVRKARRMLDLGRPVDLRESDAVPTAATVGLIWPVVVLPSKLVRSVRRDLVENAIFHEMAHVKRWDAVATLYRRLLEALLFFHPLVWKASRSYELEQEHLCDDWAVGLLGDRQGYARSLAELAEWAARGPRVAALSFAHRPGAIRRRVTRLVEGREMRSPRLGRLGIAFVATVSVGLLGMASLVPLAGTRAEAATETPPPAASAGAQAVPRATTMVLQHDDDAKDGQRSLGGSGHFVQYECPPGRWWLTEVRVCGARYGSVQPPPDQFTISVCDEQFRTLWSIKKPYSVFGPRGVWQTYIIRVPPLELPSRQVEVKEDLAKSVTEPVPFWINLAFNPSRTRGVYVGYDSSDPECFSKMGLPGQQPLDIPEKYDWMVRLTITDTRPEQVVPGLGQWMEPEKPLLPWDQAGLTELKHDDGESDGKMSMGGAGPAVRFEGVPLGARLDRLRIYGSRYGSGYDPETTYADYYVYDDQHHILQTGRFSYALFAYQEQWVDVPIEPVGVPRSFWVLVNPKADRYKGIYTHYDRDIATSHSMAGRAPEETRPLRELQDWMIRAYVEPRQPKGE